MMTREENELLTRVGPGTPGGELLRRYWQPVAIAQELTEENPTKFVRVLCENLVLFRDKTGRVGLIEDRCSHRGGFSCLRESRREGYCLCLSQLAIRRGGQLFGNSIRTCREQVQAHGKADGLSSTKISGFVLGLYGAGSGSGNSKIRRLGA